MKKLTLQKINKKEFTQMLKQMLMVDRFITLRIGTENTDTTSYLPQHDVVKRLVIANESLFASSSEPLEKPFRISLNDGNNLINRLANYGENEDVDLQLTYDDSEDAENYVVYANLISERLTTRIFCADKRFMNAMKPLGDNVIARLIDTDGCDFTFEFGADMIADVQTLNKLDPNNKFCIYRTEKERLYISERVSDSDVEHEGSEDKDAYGYNMFLVNMEGVADKEYRCGKNIFTVTPKCDMSVSVCGNAKKVVYEGTEDNEHIWLIAVLTNAPTA